MLRAVATASLAPAEGLRVEMLRTFLAAGAVFASITAATAQDLRPGDWLRNAFGLRIGEKIVSMNGIDTAHSSISVRTGKGKLGQFKGNCESGDFDAWNSHYRFIGVKKQDEVGARYSVFDPELNEEKDGSTASGYPEIIAVFHALCPSKAAAPFFYKPN